MLCCTIVGLTNCQSNYGNNSSQIASKTQTTPQAAQTPTPTGSTETPSNGYGFAPLLPPRYDTRNKEEKQRVLKEFLTGKWIRLDNKNTDCNLRIEFSALEHLCVASNNIYADVRYKLDAEKMKVDVYLDATTDLSEAAQLTPWKDVDKSQPIAMIDISGVSSNGVIKVNWIGFTNRKTGETYDYGKESHHGERRKQRSEEMFQE